MSLRLRIADRCLYNISTLRFDTSLNYIDLICRHSCMRKHHHLHSFSRKFSIDLDEIYSAAKVCESDKARADFVSLYH